MSDDRDQRRSGRPEADDRDTCQHLVMVQKKSSDSDSGGTGGNDNDITKEGAPLLRPLIALALPSVLQSVLSNMYGFNDYIFVGNMRDKTRSSIATSALSSIVGIQIIMFALHNIVPSGASTRISQHVGAGSYKMVRATFWAALYSSIVLSSLVAIAGYCLVSEISQMCGTSDVLVQEAIQKFLMIILLSSPFFSLMLLVDGYYKSIGDTRTPLCLELSSLLINSALNYLLVIKFDYGIEGTAISTSLARLLPAIYGLYWICVSLAQLPDMKGIAQSLSLPEVSLVSHLEIEMRRLESAVSDVSASTSSKVSVMVDALMRTADIIDCTPDTSPREDDDDVGENGIGGNKYDNVVSAERVSDCGESLRDIASTSWKVAKIGVFDSIASAIYGVCFTSLLRLCGLLGDKQQAGLGAGMRGIEWLAFCLSEGFLVAAATAVGQCVGAEAYKRAMDVTIICCSLSALAAGAVGVPFVLFSEEISRILSSDLEIVKYCAQYVYVQGWVMALVGFEMSSYGSLLGAGGASIICYVNGTCNLLRIPMAIYCLYSDQTADVMARLTLWAFGLYRVNTFPTPTGNFYCIGGVIAITSGLKASVWFCYFSYLYCTGIHFRGSNLAKREAASSTTADYSQLPAEEESSA